MSRMKLMKVNRKFERFNFHGVPESPEISFETDHYSLYTERTTGRSNEQTQLEIEPDEATLVGRIVDDFESRTELFIRAK